MFRYGRLAAFAVLAGVLGGCTVGPDYHKPDLTVPAAFAPVAGPARTISSLKDEAIWWESFHDPELTALVERAITGNLDAQIALLRLQEARTQEAVAMAVALPDAGASGAAGSGTGSDLTRGRLAPALGAADNRDGARIKQAFGFDAYWDVDLFGKLRREIEAAGDDAQAAAAARDDVLITLIANVVRSYLDVRGLEMQAAVLDRSLATARQTVDFVRTRYDRGLTNELDVTLAERELAALKAETAPLNAQIAAGRYAIAVLIGEYPETVDPTLAKPGMIPALPASVSVGLPIELLRRRPDIREAERNLAASTARIGVATADLFPRLNVTGAIGAQGLSAATVASPLIWAVGPAVSWSLLDFGTLDGLVDIADLRSKEFLLAYKRTILQAVQQVDTAVGNYDAEQKSLQYLADAIAASQHSVSLASQRYDRGLTDFLNVLDAERQEYELEARYAVTQQAAGDALVALYQGLGGGWEKYQSVPPIRQPQPAVVAAFRRLFDPDATGK